MTTAPFLIQQPLIQQPLTQQPLAQQFLTQHMGELHAWEQVLVLLLAFGPFILLGLVVLVVRRRDIAEEEHQERQEADGLGSDTPDL